MKEKKLPAGLHRDTLAVRTGLPASQWGENSEALFLTSGFVQPDAETMAHRFATRRKAIPTAAPPTPRSPASSSGSRHGGHGSGHRHVHRQRPPSILLGMGVLRAGDHVICSRSVFGSTLNLFAKEFGKFGVESTFVSQVDLKEWQAAVRPNTKLLFAETPTNPLTDVCDITALANLARGAGALLAVDNCFCSPALQRPTELGADFIIHSGTKYLDGQGRVMAGAICGSAKWIVDVFAPIVRTAGMTLAPFNARVGGLRLGIRMQAQCANALEIPVP